MPHNTNLAALFEQTLNRPLSLKREGKNYSLTENNINYVFRSPSNKSFAFRIEKIKIFSDNPPQDVAKMCDAVFITKYEDKNYIIAVEVKTKHKGDYKKQIRNAQYFCHWIIQLLKESNHYNKEHQFIGLLVWQVNPSQPRKNPSTPSQFQKTDSAFYETSTTPIYLNQLINLVAQTK